jgi:peroxiredoxin
MKSIFRVLVLSIFIFSVIAVGYSTFASAQLFSLGHPLVGKTAPEFSLSNLSGETKSLDELRGDNAAIVFFWAIWCPHCRNQLPDLSKEKAVMKKNGIELILVDLDEPLEKVKSYMKKSRVDLDVLIDKNSKTAKKYAVSGVPSLYFIDKKGVIKAVKHRLPNNYKKLLSK